MLSPVEITKGGKSIWFVPELCQMEIVMLYNRLNQNGKVKIRVNHYPIQANSSQAGQEMVGYPDYDLSIAGHYRGGQIRLPFIKALYIPSPASGILNGYFPKQNEVMGLNQILQMQQYISAGLGASVSNSFLAFRLYNTPEVNYHTEMKRVTNFL